MLGTIYFHGQQFFGSFYITTSGRHCRKNVECTIKCPTNNEELRKRSSEFGCKSSIYTCILDDHDRLVELCAFHYDIPSDMDGCPVMTCGSDGAGLSPSSFAFCPKDVKGCPDGSYGTYNTSTIYLYPKCLLRLQDRFSRGCGYDLLQKKGTVTDNNKSIETTQSTTRDTSWMWACLLPVIVSSLILNVICAMLLFILIWQHHVKGKRTSERVISANYPRRESAGECKEFLTQGL